MPSAAYLDLLSLRLPPPCQAVSIGFLAFFLVDVVLRLYSIGYTYFKSILHFIDAVAIVVTLAMAINGQSAEEMAKAQINACLASEYAAQCGKLQASDTANAAIRNVKLLSRICGWSRKTAMQLWSER